MVTEKREFGRKYMATIIISALVMVFLFAAGAQAAPKVGDVITFGKFDWCVLDVQGNKALIITKDIIEKRVYNVKNENVTWKTCTLREYLNGEFLQENFTGEEKGRIAETTIQNPNNPQYRTDGGGDTTDMVFLLSFEEAGRYFADSGGRIAKYGNNASWWWLRSPGLSNDCASLVVNGGDIDIDGRIVPIDDGGVRPALWLKF